MDVSFVAIVVLLGAVPACAIERTKFDLGVMHLVLATVFTIFGVTALALMAFVRLDTHGVLFTYLAAMVLHLVFVLSNRPSTPDAGNAIANYVFWFSLLFVSTVFGLGLGRVGLRVCDVYHCTSLDETSSLLLLLTVISGGISMLMIFREASVRSAM